MEYHRDQWYNFLNYLYSQLFYSRCYTKAERPAWAVRRRTAALRA
jgi:hypothetical protein